MIASAPPEEITYRFPYSRGAVEIIPDHGETFGLRLVWQRGKAPLTLFETTPLRPVGQITYAGLTLPLALNRHKRVSRENIRFFGERKACATGGKLRYEARVTGRGDRLEWEWRFQIRGKGLPAEHGDIVL